MLSPSRVVSSLELAARDVAAARGAFWGGLKMTARKPPRPKEKDRWTATESDSADEYRVSGEFPIADAAKMRAFVKQVKMLGKRLKRSVRAREAAL